MKTIDVIATRHEKKASDIKPISVGDVIDREQVSLSLEGFADAGLLGHRELARDYDHIFILTSDFLRTKQTADSVLEGAGYDIGKLRDDSRRITFRTTDRIGLSGTNWSTPNTPPFGTEQEVLDAHVNYLMANYFLERADQPGNPKNHPVMARSGAALLKGLADGIVDVAARLKPQQRGLVLIVTHAPIIDALAATYGNRLQLTPTTEKEAYKVQVAPFEAHNMGQYMKGTVAMNDDLEKSYVPLEIKGKEHVLRVKKLKEKSSRLHYLAFNAVQK
jgi:broad specificity phosphatase PhoE